MFTRAKKSLGQHFLKDGGTVHAMVEAGNLSDKDTVVEIGPGKGVLTKSLLESGARVVAIEKDSELIPYLNEAFNSYIESGKLVLIEEDVLAFDPIQHGLNTCSYKVVANIPYYITGAIIEHFLSHKNYPERMILLVQKEVAERIVARDGKESILSISVKIFGTPKNIRKVPSGAFNPPPKVDSAVLTINDISHKAFADRTTMNFFFTVLKSGFAHKRKLLIRNLEKITSKENLALIFGKLGIDIKGRAEDLPYEAWSSIVRELTDCK